MLLERLESRINLAAATLVSAIDSTIGQADDSSEPASALVPAAGQVSALTTSAAAVVAPFRVKQRIWTSSVDVVVPSLPDTTSLRLEAAAGLTYWNGRQAPSFMPARSNVRIDLSLGGRTAAIRADGTRPETTLALAASASNRVAARIAVDGAPARAAAGWYALSTNVVDGSGANTPVTLLFSRGRVPVGSRGAAIRAVGGVGPKPAVVAVGVTLASPPVTAPPSVDAPTTVATDSPGVSAATASQAILPVQSPPSFVLPAAVDGIVEVSTAITSDTTFRAGSVYVITSEVHVASRVTLTIEDGVEVRIRNGRGRFGLLTTPALIFESGSSLVAENVTFQASNASNEPVQEADNGGVFFCGGTLAASRDNVSSWDTQLYPSSFTADSIVANYLGRRDPPGGDGDGPALDDIDAVSVVGVVYAEWNVKAVETNHSGNNGFSMTDAWVRMASVRVHDPVEDGINLTGSSLHLDTLLQVRMNDGAALDREIFDFEVDGGIRSQIELPQSTATRTTRVDLQGIWDNSLSDDWIDVSSLDMRIPEDGIRQSYEWNGELERSAARIFASDRAFPFLST